MDRDRGGVGIGWYRDRVVFVDVVVDPPPLKKNKKNIKTGQTTAIFFE